jgi:hypothetical protein
MTADRFLEMTSHLSSCDLRRVGTFAWFLANARASKADLLQPFRRCVWFPPLVPTGD